MASGVEIDREYTMDQQAGMITTTPPVYEEGPSTGIREVGAGDTVHRVGLDSMLRAEFERVGEELAAKHTRTAIVVPVRQLVDVVVEVIADLPRVPDYDDVSARQAMWSETTLYSPVELPDDDPDTIGVHAEGETVKVRFGGGDAGVTVVMDPEHAEGFFLAGLAATRHAMGVRAEAERVRERQRNLLIVPSDVRP